MARRDEPDDAAGRSDRQGAADADARYFARAMADVVRLAPDPRGRVPAAPHVSATRSASPSTPSASRPDTPDHSEATGFVAPGVNRRELRRLTRGEHTPDRRLDLHGMTAAEAVANVTRMIDTGGHRCVCIVHGRGAHSTGNVSILKTRVRQCLRQHRAVLAYADAPRADGGAGAVYVLLRKNGARR